LTQVLEEHGDDSARYVLTSLIDEIHENGDRITLVVDDWHRYPPARRSPLSVSCSNTAATTCSSS
jgi:ATP/maltotriose-dependent transcriptional regulator MalT